MTTPLQHSEEMAYYLGDFEGLKNGEVRANEWSVLYATIRAGLPVRNARIMRERVSPRVFDRSVIPRTTLSSKANSGRLSTAQSERAVRIGRVYARAAEVFGNRERGRAWMDRANRTLDSRTPAELLDN
ncbi:MAG: antitoxin Xre/MbcA/ParS toxin-binding domain-containing protein, partial [Halofilum sp. (in: g-proteobacteria)]